MNGEVKITGVRAIQTAPQPGSNLIVVRIDTNQPGLYGLGCATFTQRHAAVVTAIETYMSQLLIGRNALDVEDAYRSAVHSSYWRNGPILNNAISGCDMALWDILGKEAGMPVYRLLGGKCRPAVSVYRHADGRDINELEENIRKFMEQGYQYIRCQMGGYGGNMNYMKTPPGAIAGAYCDPEAYARSVVKMFEEVRVRLGDELELLHDVHERLQPISVIRLARQLEPYRLFFLEDPLGPEDVQHFGQLRASCATPIAMGELFNNPSEWRPLIENRWIDYIRCHISQIGGITPAKHLASQCEPFSVRTAWHGPGDVSPVGHAANLHLDFSTHNFGIQEWCGFETDPRIQEVFTGLPYIKDGFAYLDEKPGLGVDINEEAAKKYPVDLSQPHWLLGRMPDGTSMRA